MFSGLDISGRRVGDSFPVRGTIWDEGVRTRRGMIFQSENLEDYLDKFPSLTVSIQAGIESVMGIPLISKDQVIGNLLIRSKKPFAYTEHDLRLAEKIGTDIAGAIANAQLFTDLKKTETSLRESEGRFRSLFEQAAVGVAEIEITTGRFFTVNHRLGEILGRTEEELLAATFHMFTHPEDIHLHEGKTAQLLAGKVGYYSLEKRYLRKDGETVWINLTVSPLWKPGESHERNMIVVEDITERKRADDQVRLAREVLDLLNHQSNSMDTIHDILQRIFFIDSPPPRSSIYSGPFCLNVQVQFRDLQTSRYGSLDRKVDFLSPKARRPPPRGQRLRSFPQRTSFYETARIAFAFLTFA
jgi:PAS domain S-box-containing protein